MATSIIKLHTFSGAGDNGPPCFLLQIDDFYCLLDCGWSDDVPLSHTHELSKWIKKINAVLISHPSMRHLGLLPHLVGKYGLKCPIYATTPVYKLGQLFLYDAYQSRFISEDFDLFSLDDIDNAFELFVQVKYQQTINLQGKGRGLSVTPLPSGHMLGGTIWKLIKDETDIVYAVDFNHKKSRHLNGATFDACIRPRLLILDSSNALYAHPRRKDREEALRQILLKTLRRGGNVLIVVDTAGYCLEIANLLETLWHSQDSGFMAYGLAMLTHVAFNVFDFTKSLVEWMSEKIMRTFEDLRSNPFALRHLQLCHTLDALDCVSNPKVILASEAGLRSGFSRFLFAEWADSDLNTVILTSRDGDFRQVESFSRLQGTFDQSSREAPSLVRRLIGLANKEPWAQLPTNTHGKPILPFILSQRAVVDGVSDTETKPCEHPKEESHAVPPSPMVGFKSGPPTTPKGPPAKHPLQFFSDKSFSLDASVVMANVSSAMEDDDEDEEEEDSKTLTPTTRRDRMGSLSGNLIGSADGGADKMLSNVSGAYQPYEVATLAATATGAGTLTHGRHQTGYDIFPGACNATGGHFFRMAKRTQLVFPTVEKTVLWDEYGEHIDPTMYKMSAELTDSRTVEKCRRQPDTTRLNQESVVALEQLTKAETLLLPNAPHLDLMTATSDQLLDLLVVQNSATPDAKLASNFSTKCVVQKLELPLRCELCFIDYESRSDGEALKKILTGLKPQEVILVGATRQAIDVMEKYCTNQMMLKPDLIHVPSGMDVVNCTKEDDIYQARMKDSLVTGLKFTKIREYELAWVDADLVAGEEATKQGESMDDDDDSERASATRHSILSDALPMLVPPVSGFVAEHATVFVNEPKLSDLKQILLTKDLTAEFVSGVLVVENCVAIKRSEAGRLILEGKLSKTYYDVRNVLYQQFAIL